MKKFIFWFLMSAGISAFAQSVQKNELGLLLGAESIPQRTTAPGGNVDFSNGIIFSANYARLLVDGNTAVFLEFPFAASPNHDVSIASNGSITALATLYITPSLRVNFAHQARVSPWLSGGFGYGLYEGSANFRDGTVNPDVRNSTGTAQFGGGVDLRTGRKLLLPVTLRGEVRDYYTLNSPRFGIPAQGDGQHNVVAAGGIVLRF